MSIQLARNLRKNMTDAERLLSQHLRSGQAGGCKFRRQHPIGSFIVDFICIDKNLIIEVDGGQHSLQAGADEERTNYLQGKGFRVLRFWNHEVLQNLESVLSLIYSHLEQNPTSP
jgi:very-short-patch-repair endonuclease